MTGRLSTEVGLPGAQQSRRPGMDELHFEMYHSPLPGIHLRSHSDSVNPTRDNSYAYSFATRCACSGFKSATHRYLLVVPEALKNRPLFTRRASTCLSLGLAGANRIIRASNCLSINRSRIVSPFSAMIKSHF